MQAGYEKITIFDQYLASSRVVNRVTVRCCKQSADGGPWQVGDTHRTKRRRLFIAGDGRRSATRQ